MRWTLGRARSLVAVVSLAVVLGALPGVPAVAQGTTSATLPPIAPCLPFTGARFPYHEANYVPTQSFANSSEDFLGRFHPGEDWGYGGNPAHKPVHAIGAGKVVYVGNIQPGPLGGIVVIQHGGPINVPASTPGAAYTYPASTEATILSVYLHIDPTPGLASGSCVTSDTQIGVTTAWCEIAPAPCSRYKTHLHLEVRLAGTADPTKRTSDWSVAGDRTHWSGGYFYSAQQMVDDGMREPSTFIQRATSRPGGVPAATPRPALKDLSALTRGDHPKRDFDRVSGDVLALFASKGGTLATLYPGLVYDEGDLAKTIKECKTNTQSSRAWRHGSCRSIANELVFSYGLSRDDRFYVVLDHWIDAVLNLKGMPDDMADYLGRSIVDTVDSYPEYFR